MSGSVPTSPSPLKSALPQEEQVHNEGFDDAAEVLPASNGAMPIRSHAGESLNVPS